MEATIQSTNRAINIDTNVSINVDALKTIIQRAWSAVVKLSIINFQFSIWRLYRKELRLARAVAAWCGHHNTLTNWLMAIQVMAFAFYVFMFV